MREFLEDAEGHRKDGYRAAQRHAAQDLPKRFYRETGIAPVPGGFTVTLDGHPTRTPGRTPVVVPIEAVARIMADEWAAQGERLDPALMPMIRLVNSTIESGEDKVPALVEEILHYAANDLLLYRADGPESLVRAQELHWDGALVGLARHFAVRFMPTVGITHQPQPEATLTQIAGTLAGATLFEAAPLNSITTLTGSGLLAIALYTGLMSGEAVWAAAHVDEDFQISQWGEIEEARNRRNRRRTEFDAAVRLLALARGGQGAAATA